MHARILNALFFIETTFGMFLFGLGAFRLSFLLMGFGIAITLLHMAQDRLFHKAICSATDNGVILAQSSDEISDDEDQATSDTQSLKDKDNDK